MKTSAAALLFVSISSVLAETYTWVGGSNGMAWTWDPEGLWDLPGAPGPNDTARFQDTPFFEARKNSGRTQSVSLIADTQVDTIVFADSGVATLGCYQFPFTFNHLIGEDYFGEDAAATNGVAGNIWLGATNATIHIGLNRTITFGDFNGANPNTSLTITGPGTAIFNGGFLNNNITGTTFVEQGTLIVRPDWRNSFFVGPFILGDGEHRAVFETGSNFANHFRHECEITVNSNSVMRFHPASNVNGTSPYTEVVHLNYAEVDLATLYLTVQRKARNPLLEMTGTTIRNGTIRFFIGNVTNDILVTHASSVPSLITSDWSVGGYPIYVNIEDGEAPIDCEMAGELMGGIRINKHGAGTWLWSGPNGAPTYYRSGHSVEVLEGALIVNNVQNSGVGSNNVNVASGALFGGTGMTFGERDPTYPRYGIPGNINLAGGETGPATFAPGTPDPATGIWQPGTFRVGYESFTNNVTFGNASVLRCTITKQGASSLAIHGWLHCDSAQNTDALEITTSESRLPAGTYTLASFTQGIRGRFDEVTVQGDPLYETSARLAYLDTEDQPITDTSYAGAGRIVLTVPPEETLILFQ